MTQEKKEMLLKNGIDFDELSGRFMNKEDLAEKYLKKFINDDNMEKLEKEIKAQNAEEAFCHAHTLKGVCANLSIKCINEQLHPLVEVLRSNSIEGTEEMFERVKKVYDEVCEIIKCI